MTMLTVVIIALALVTMDKQNMRLNKLPVRIHPEKDEGFLSWLCRIAAGNGLSVPSFLRLTVGDADAVRILTKVKTVPGSRLLEKLASGLDAGRAG